MSHELIDLALVLVAVALLAIGLWAAVDPRSCAATCVAWAARRVGGPRRLVVILLAAVLFAAVAEDAMWRDDQDWVVLLDRHADEVGREMGRDPAIRAVARAISFSTGAGLVGVLAVAGAMLVWAGRPRAAFILLLGTAGGWLADLVFKLVFRVPRPGRSHEAAFVYGFPSGHTFVTLIAVGLLVWICARRLPRPVRLALYAVGLAVAVVTGASRIVLHAHWLSDIVAALALGSLYLVAATTWLESVPRASGTIALARLLRKRRAARRRLTR